MIHPLELKFMSSEWSNNTCSKPYCVLIVNFSLHSGHISLQMKYNLSHPTDFKFDRDICFGKVSVWMWYKS